MNRKLQGTREQPCCDAAGLPMTVDYNGEIYYYVTNLQGDVIAIADDSGNVKVEHTYDAWGNPLAISGGMASTLGKHNPLRYRGYVYDAETNLYYLQSRYYDAEIGRFISPEPNVDFGAFDEGAGLIGYNVYAYCANNPVIFKDEAGESITFVIFGVALTVKELVAICAIGAGLWCMSLPAFQRWVNNTVNTAVAGIKAGLGAIGSGAKSVYSKAKKIGETVFDSYAKAKTVSKYKSTREKHHIVAQKAPNAKKARDILDRVGMGYNSSENLVSLKTGLHRRLHTNLYYGWANSVIISAYNAAGGNKAMQRRNVSGALATIKSFLLTLDATVPY